MAEESRKRSSAAEDSVSEVLKFNPMSLWRTFVIVWRAGVTSDRRLGEAIATQSWDEVLSPFKYAIGVMTALLLGGWAIDTVRTGSIGKPESASFLDPTILPILLAAFAASVPIHFALYWAGSEPRRQVPNGLEGVFRSFQMLMFAFGNFLVFFALLIFGGGALLYVFGSSAEFWIMMIVALVSGGLILVPLLYGTLPKTLGYLYGLSPGSAGAILFVVWISFVMLVETIVTGKLPV